MAKNKKTKNARSRLKKTRAAWVEIKPSATAPARRVTLQEALALANSHAMQRQTGVAHFIYHQLMEQLPNNSEPAIHLLRSLYTLGDMDAAQLHVYRMLAAYNGDSGAIAEVAAFYNFKGDDDKALEVLSNGLSKCSEDTHHTLYRIIGNIFDNQGNSEQAAHYYQQALSIHPRDISCLFFLVKLKTGPSRQWLLQQLRDIEAEANVELREKPFLHFALAYLYEKQDKAAYFRHLQMANDCLKQDPAPFLNKLTEFYQRAIAQPPQALACAPRNNPPARQSPLFIVAPPRSGTTLLEQIVGAHPAVTAIGESGAVVSAVNRVCGELNLPAAYWDWDETLCETALNKLDDVFFAHQRIKSLQTQQVIDKSLENFQYVGHILATWPDAKIIRLKRHPLDTILSCYHQFFGAGYDRFFDLETLAHYYVIVERYMDLWQERFPNSVLTVEYEALISDQEQQTRRLLAFCELPWDDACLDFHRHVGSVLTASNQQVRQPLYSGSVAKWKALRTQLQPAIAILERELNLSFAD